MSPDWRGGGPWRRCSRHRDRHRRQGRLLGGHAAGGAPVCFSGAVRCSRSCRRLDGLSLEATHPTEVNRQGGWARVRVVERAEAPRQSEPAVVEARRCPDWRPLAHDEELPCGNSHSTRRSCLCAQSRQIESVSPPIFPTSARPKTVEFWMGHLPMGTGHLPIPLPWPDRPPRCHDKLCRNAPQNALRLPLFGTVCARLA